MSREENHHLFTYYEVRRKLVQVFGQPKTQDEHDFLHKEIKRVRAIMPKYKVSHEKHVEIHKQD